MEQNLFSADINELTFSCFEKPYYPKGYVFNVHYHKRPEIMYVVSGKLDVAVFRGEQKVSEPLTKNQFILFECNVPHGFIVAEENTMFWTLEFDREREATIPARTMFFSLSALLKECPALAVKLKKNGYAVYYDQCDLEGAIDRLTETYGASSYAADKDEDTVRYREHDFLFKTYLQEIFILISLNASLCRPTGSQYISRIDYFLQKNYATEFTLDDLAKAVGINKNYMERIYKKCTGTNIHRQIILLRCEKAGKLLCSTSLPIEKIARDTGFGVRQQLIYNFKNIFGVTPREYRLQNKKNDAMMKPDDETISSTYDFIPDERSERTH